MNIALVGYGKMGRMIESVAAGRGHRVVLTIDVDNLDDFTRGNLAKADVAIEFTRPDTAFENVWRCIDFGVAVVSGSTGWYDRMAEVQSFCTARGGSMLCTSNFSLGVNIFFEINRRLARMMNGFADYAVEIEETHHTQKVDAPSGTAISLAEGVIGEISRIHAWQLDGDARGDLLPVRAIRRDNVPGTHRVRYSSPIDDIEITHTAHNREGLALGAVMAAEYIHDKKGVFTMKDVLPI